MTRNSTKGRLDQFKLILCLRHRRGTKPEFRLVTEIACVWKE